VATYIVTDPQSGKKIKLTGDSPPTEQELEDIFASQVGTSEIDWDKYASKPKQEQAGFLDMVKRGVVRGTKQTGSLLGDVLPALAASAVGADDYARQQMGEAEDTQKDIEQNYGARYKSLSDVKGIGDYIPFAAETIAEQVPNLATALIPGVGVGAIGARMAATQVAEAVGKRALAKGLTEAAAAKLAARALPAATAAGAKTGQVVGTYLGSYALNTPEIFQNIYNETGTFEPGAAALAGSVSAALDSVLPASVLARFTPGMKAGVVEKLLERSGMEKGISRAAIASTIGGAATEGITEPTQEAISIIAEKFVQENASAWDSDDFNRLVEAGVRGAVGGGGISGISGTASAIVERGRERDKREQKEFDEEEARKQTELKALYPGGQQLELLPEDPNFIEATDEFAPEKPVLGREAGAKKLQQEYLARIADPKAQAAMQERFDVENRKMAKEDAEIGKAQDEAIAEDQPLPVSMEKKLEELKAQKARYDTRTTTEIKEVNAAIELANKDQRRGKDGRIIPTLAVPRQTSLFDAKGDTTKLARPALWADSKVTIMTPEVTKSLGIGFTAGIHKELDGKDLTDPIQAAEVMTAIEEYANRRGSATGRGSATDKAVKNIPEFLNRPEFAVVKEQRYSEAQQQAGDLFPETVTNQQDIAATEEMAALEPMKGDSARQQTLFTPTGRVSKAADITKDSAAAWEDFAPEGIKYSALTKDEKQKWFDLHRGNKATQQTAHEVVGRDAEAESQEGALTGDARVLHKQTADRAVDMIDLTATMLSPEYAAGVLDNLNALNKRIAKFGPQNNFEREDDAADAFIRQEEAKQAEQEEAKQAKQAKQEEAKAGVSRSKVNKAATPTVGDFLAAVRRMSLENAAAGENKGEGATGKNKKNKKNKKKVARDEGDIFAEEHAGLFRDQTEFKNADEIAIELGKQLGRVFTGVDAQKNIKTLLESEEGAAGLMSALHSARMASLINAFRVIRKERAGAAALNKNKGKKGYEMYKTDAQSRAEEVVNHASVLPEERAQAEELARITPKGAREAAKRYREDESRVKKLQQEYLARTAEPKRTEMQEKFDVYNHKRASESIYTDLFQGGNSEEDEAAGREPPEFIDVAELFRPVGLQNDFGIFTQEGSPVVKPYKYAPKYKGVDLDATGKGIVQKGDLRGTLNHLISITKNPIVKQVLERIRALNLKTKIVMGEVSKYDSNIDTITIAPDGINEHVLTHELLHAAISHVLRDPTLTVTKELTKLFQQINNQLGTAYGASDIQEFAAELGSNAEFQAILKKIKAPRSGSLWSKIVQVIAEFFGFRKGQTALDAGLKFINDALDISGDIEPSLGDILYVGGSKTLNEFSQTINNNMPSLFGRTIDNTENFISNMVPAVRRLALGLLRLDNLNTIYGKALPSILKLLDALELRSGSRAQAMQAFKTALKEMVATSEKLGNKKFVGVMGAMAVDAHIAKIDLLDPNFKPTTPNQYNEWLRLKGVYRSLPGDMKGVYKDVIQGYKDKLMQFRDVLMVNSAGDPVAQADIKKKFDDLMAGNPSYVPSLRHGKYKVEFIDPDTDERASVSFESVKERADFIGFLEAEEKKKGKKFDIQEYTDLIDESKLGRVIAKGTLGKIIAGMQKSGATPAQIKAVREAYFEAFPAHSIMQRFRKSQNVAGMETNIIDGYKEMMPIWINKINNSQYMPQIDAALKGIESEARAAKGNRDPQIRAMAEVLADVSNHISKQSNFFQNPTFSTFAKAGTQLSYGQYIAGNISSALINVLTIPMLLTPILGGRFGLISTNKAIASAMKEAVNWYGKDGKYTGNARYTDLYKLLLDHDQLGGVALDALKDAGSNPAQRLLSFTGIPFGATEKYNRAVAAIAAYELALAGDSTKGIARMSPTEAARYALTTVKDINTSGLMDTAPAFAQNSLGRTFYTFKSYTWNTTFILARAWHQAFKGKSKAERAEAAKQLLGVYAMAAMFGGAKGLPFMGAASVLAYMMQAMANAFGDDDEEPYDFNTMLREFVGELAYKGPVNYYTNLEIASRTGIANDLVFRDDPQGVEAHGYVMEAFSQIFGPALSTIVNVEKGLKMVGEGHLERGIETMVPSVFRNIMKGLRFMEEGALTLKGDPLVEDVNGWNNLMQLAGFSPADLTLGYETTGMRKKVESYILERKKAILDAISIATTAGDSEMLADAFDRMRKFNTAYPEERITGGTISKSRRARITARENQINGVAFDPKLKRRLENMFPDDEDEDEEDTEE